MASTYSDLKFELIGTGEQSGTWGTTTNTNIGTAIQEAITGSGDVTFASGAVALTLTNSNAAQTARNLRLNLTGTSGGAQNLTVPDIEKFYLVNNGCADAITVKNSTGATVAVPAGKAMLLFSTGSAIVDAVSHMSSVTLTTALAVSSGGTGSTTAGGARTNLGLGALAVLAQVDTAQIVDDAVTTAKILDANVTAGKIATDAVTTVKILDANVTTAKILDANVTDAKIATMASSKLTGALPAIDGSALTSLTSGNLTGALPAIDGSALTGLGGGGDLQTQLFTAPGTWTYPGTATNVRVTVVGGGAGGYWNSGGGNGGTSSFGAFVSATGGVDANSSGGTGPVGTGTTSTGTAFVGGSKRSSIGTVIGMLYGGSSSLVGSPTAYSTTGVYLAGAGAPNGPAGGRGGSGGLAIALVPISSPVSVTVGAGGAKPPPAGQYAGTGGAVVVEWVG